MIKVKISLGSDHAGFELKEHVKKYLESKGIEFVDEGTYSTESVDYPVFAKKVVDDLKNKKSRLWYIDMRHGFGNVHNRK
jgi:ribose 5-phosphate isomerase B